MQRVVIVIPARYSSTRLPAKPLADICGKPMIQWVYERSKLAKGIADTVVATDDDRIAQEVKRFGGKVVMTPASIQSGTERVAAVSDQMDADIYVNVQGDEPLIDPVAIERAVDLVVSKKFPLATVMTSLKNEEELRDPSVVKVISDRNQRAIYFSRLPIPYSRGPIPSEGIGFACMKHIGLYVYRKETLRIFRDLPSSSLEKGEVLEQLRALENGIPIGIAHVECHSIGVDTPTDLEKVRQVLGR